MSFNPLCSLFEELFPNHNFKWMPAGSSTKCFCPYHENKNTRSMVLYEDNNHRWHWYCFADKFGGTEVHAVMRALNLSRANANRWLIKKGRSPESEQDLEEELKHERFSAFLAHTNNALCNSEEAAGLRAYLVSRGISATHLSKMPIGFYESVPKTMDWVVDNEIPEDQYREFAPEKNVEKWAGSIAFFYKNSYNRYNRIKLRNVILERATGGDKVTFFLGNKRKFEGYFSASQQDCTSDHAIVVEGEFDVLALFSLILKEDPDASEQIHCFSGGSNMIKGVDSLKELGTEQIYIFPDNDVAGIDYVNAIADVYPHTFIMSPKDYKDKEDPAEWAKMHVFNDLQESFRARIPAYTWIGRMYARMYSNETPENRSAARDKVLTYAKKLLPVSQEAFLSEFAPMTGVSLEVLKEELQEITVKKYKKITRGVDFGVHMQWQTGKKNEWLKLANFIPEHEYDILYDDGNPNKEKERSYAIRLITKDKAMHVKITNTEYNDDRRLQTLYQAKLGSLGQISPKMIGYLRDASLSFFAEEGSFREDLIYSHTGWNGDKYLMPNCYIDSEGYQPLGQLTVELPPSLGVMFPYGLAQPYQDLEPIKKIIREDLLTMFPYSVTLPSIAHTFLTPLLEFMPEQSPYAMWLHGITGTFKSTFASLLLSFFGKNSGANGLISINSTVNAIEKMGYHLKDVLVVLDDYKKATIKDELLTRLIQNYGGRQGRSRLNNRSELQQTYYIRGNVIITAEDIPTGESSVTARTLLVPIPTYPNMDKLNKCQANAHHFSSLYAKYIEFVLDKRRTVDFSALCNPNQRSKFSTQHHRVNTNLALNSIGWEFFAEFMGCQDLSPEYYKVTSELAGYMNSQTKSEQASEIFIEALFDMLSVGSHYLEGKKGMMDTQHNDRAMLIGYIEPDYVYVKGSAVIAEMNRKRRMTHGNAVQFSSQAINDQLRREQKLVLDPKRPTENTVMKKIGGITVPCLKFSKEVFNSLNDTDYAEQKV